MAEHRTLTGDSLHEPKGADTAALEQLYHSDGAGSGVWKLPSGRRNNLVVVQSAADLTGTLDSTKEYLIDGIIDMGGVSIEVPAGGLNLRGYSFNTSKLISSAAGYTMFVSPVGGSGDLLGVDYAIEVTGAGSQVYALVDATGLNAFEFSRINYNNCTSLGIITGYRQGLESGTGRFGGTPTLTLAGTWVGGFFMETSIVRNMDAGLTEPLFKAGAGFTMASRFRSNFNVDLPAGASLLDFSPSNFTNPSTLQLEECLISRGGVFNAADTNLTPNIASSDLACAWNGNTGLNNTFEGGETSVSSEVTTTISSIGAFVDLSGVFTPSDLQHFDSPAAGQLRHLGTSPIDFSVVGQFVIDSTSGNVVTLKVVVYRSATASFEDGKTQSRVINNLQGGRDVAYFVLSDKVTLNQNDYIKLQVANATTTNNVVAELDSYLSVQGR